ncbi:putative TP53-regulating kinase [Paratrimastix pyriformis]|uniref:non-specific serine/threonine protein kinase n=1 Tax=Paratrimastix pyriformis TaxID=342808 RepID=A0ABQ8UMK4_9EUKA|nr:putative TP53-regulating kinase [Paratrimastix pyriformis]
MDDLLGMGAEATVRKITFAAHPAVSKIRPVKTYRHPVLDQKLRSRRTATEARCMERALKAGVCAPAVLRVDKKENCEIIMEYIAGQTVRAFLHRYCPLADPALGPGPTEDEPGDEGIEGEQEEEHEEEHHVSEVQLEAPASAAAAAAAATATAVPAPGAALPPAVFLSGDLPLKERMDEAARKIGGTIARLHNAGICHGDLTTSNMMFRDDSADLVLIDFGLAFMSSSAEDKAVDLYVLERALLATHPNSKALFDGIMENYARTSTKGEEILARLVKVRARGRKKSMAG